MNLLSVSRARALWFIHMGDLNPRGLDMVPILSTIRSHYRFQISPSKPEDIYSAQNGIEFARGSFGADGGKAIEIESLKIYRDGILVDTRHSTKLSDAVLDDLVGLLVQRHAVSFEPAMVRRKAYLSEVVVSTSHVMDGLNENLRQFSALLADEVAENREFQPVAIRFGTDPAKGSELLFSFERQVAVSFQEDRYFSSAPLTTHKHLKVLDAWERILAL